MARQFPALPDHAELMAAALGLIAEVGSYSPNEMQAMLAEALHVTAEHRALRFTAMPRLVVFDSYVAQVLRAFTRQKLHTRDRKGRYHVTPRGMEVGRAVPGGAGAPQPGQEDRVSERPDRHD